MSLPTPMCFPVGELAFKTLISVTGTGSAHVGPKHHATQQLKKLLTPHVMVLHMQLLHQQQLLPQRGKVYPLAPDPFVKLPLAESERTGLVLEAG